LRVNLRLGRSAWSEEFLSWLLSRTLPERTVRLLSRRIETMISVVRRPTKREQAMKIVVTGIDEYCNCLILDIAASNTNARRFCNRERLVGAVICFVKPLGSFA